MLHFVFAMIGAAYIAWVIVECIDRVYIGVRGLYRRFRSKT